MANIQAKNEDHTNTLKCLLETDCSDIQLHSDFEDLTLEQQEQEGTKIIKPTWQNVLEHIDDNFDLRTTRKKLYQCTACKCSLAQSIHFQEQVLKRMRTKYEYYDHQYEVLNT